MKYEAIKEYSTQFNQKKMCEVLGVNRSNYYKWVKRNSKKEDNDRREKEEIRLIEEIYKESDMIYGYRNITIEMNKRGIDIGQYRVRRLMRENGIYAKVSAKYKPSGKGKSDGRYCENEVKQKFKVEEPNRIWAGDITYIKTSVGWVYLSVVMDLFNREIIGYEIGKRIDTELVLRALGNAIGRRGKREGMIFHSDRGCQYSSKAYQCMLEENGIKGSMNRSGCPYDNSCVESFFASLKKEKIYRRNYDTIEEVREDVFWYIEMFYNRKRGHSTLGYKTPIEYREMYA